MPLKYSGIPGVGMPVGSVAGAAGTAATDGRSLFEAIRRTTRRRIRPPLNGTTIVATAMAIAGWPQSVHFHRCDSVGSRPQ